MDEVVAEPTGDKKQTAKIATSSLPLSRVLGALLWQSLLCRPVCVTKRKRDTPAGIATFVAGTLNVASLVFVTCLGLKRIVLGEHFALKLEQELRQAMQPAWRARCTSRAIRGGEHRKGESHNA